MSVTACRTMNERESRLVSIVVNLTEKKYAKMNVLFANNNLATPKVSEASHEKHANSQNSKKPKEKLRE